MINVALKPRFYTLLAIFICLLSLAGTIFQDSYKYDPHHWGLMLSNARDLSLGLTPYKEIFIQYGILTTIIHATAFVSLGKTLSTIAFVTGIFYSIGLFLLFILARRILIKDSSALYVLIFAFLFHPISIMPWPNYIAFPFIIFGLILILNEKPCGTILDLGAGIFFGLATLCREGLFPAIFCIMCLSVLYDFFQVNLLKSRRLQKIILKVIGFLLPILIFFLYLYFSNIFSYWKTLSIDLPNIYFKEIFPQMNAYFGIPAFVRQGMTKALSFDIRWILIIFIICINAICILLSLFKTTNRVLAKNILIISASSLLFLTSAIHTYDIFRIATGSIIGLIPFVYFQGKFKKIIFFYASIPLFLTLVIGNSGNLWHPKYEQFALGQKVLSPKIFEGQIWPESIVNYYNEVANELISIKKLNCGIEYHHNHLQDAFLQVISPFKQMQLAPFYIHPQSAKNLRKDLDIFSSNVRIPKNLVLMEEQSPTYNEFAPIDGYVVYSTHSIPGGKSSLIILIGEDCQKSSLLRFGSRE